MSIVILHNPFHKKNPFLESRFLLSLVLVGFVVVLDQLTKLWILHHLTLGDSIRWASFFNITLAFNRGSAYGFLAQASGWQTPFISGIVMVVTVILFVWLSRLRRGEVLLSFAVSLIIGGALGNLIDRLRLSYVVDFFDFHVGAWHFATFNVADSAISIGAVLLVFQFLFCSKKVTT